MNNLRMTYSEPVRMTKQQKAGQAIRVLEEQIEHIRNVQAWATAIGTSRSWLVTTMREVYGRNPKWIIREVRFKKVVNLIKQDPGITGYAAGIDSGLQNDIALSKFLKLHFNIRFSELKRLIHDDNDKFHMRIVSQREIEEFQSDKKCG